VCRPCVRARSAERNLLSCEELVFEVEQGKLVRAGTGSPAFLYEQGPHPEPQALNVFLPEQIEEAAIAVSEPNDNNSFQRCSAPATHSASPGHSPGHLQLSSTQRANSAQATGHGP
jgi:hypothetical protein